jgi:large subunit ribosomal protein L18
MNKKLTRIRRGKKSRYKARASGALRLCIHRTPRHIYAQIIDDQAANVLACSSSIEAGVRSEVKYTGNIEAAKVVGKLVAERAKEKGVSKVAFDRSGFKYHGRVQALADAAREAGLEF